MTIANTLGSHWEGWRLKNHKQNHNKLTVKQVFPHVFSQAETAFSFRSWKSAPGKSPERRPQPQRHGSRSSRQWNPRERRSPQSEELGEKRRNVTFIRYVILCDSLCLCEFPCAFVHSVLYINFTLANGQGSGMLSGPWSSLIVFGLVWFSAVSSPTTRQDLGWTWLNIVQTSTCFSDVSMDSSESRCLQCRWMVTSECREKEYGCVWFSS